MNKDQAEKRLIKQQEKQRRMIDAFQFDILKLHKKCMVKYGIKQGTAAFKTKVEKIIKVHGVKAIEHGEKLANDKITKI